MVLEVANLQISDDEHEDFEAALEEGKLLIAASPGFVHLEARRCLETSGRYLLLVTWDSLEDHMEGFRTSPAFEQWRAVVSPFFASPPVVEHYDFVTEADPVG